MNINLMWRYWAAKEMAHSILKKAGFYTYGYDYLTQTLKKEWFR